MELETIKEVLMRRDHLSVEEADERIKEAKEVLKEYLDEGDTESALYVCEEMFGLEPDYVMELIP